MMLTTMSATASSPSIGLVASVNRFSGIRSERGRSMNRSRSIAVGRTIGLITRGAAGGGRSGTSDGKLSSASGSAGSASHGARSISDSDMKVLFLN
jgi:hypothetical protein